MSLYCKSTAGLCHCQESAGHEGDHTCGACCRSWPDGQQGISIVTASPVASLVGAVNASPARAVVSPPDIGTAPAPTNTLEERPS